jgi:hypothetical protein
MRTQGRSHWCSPPAPIAGGVPLVDASGEHGSTNVNLTKARSSEDHGLPPAAPAPLGAGFDAYAQGVPRLDADAAVEVYLADVFPSSSGAAKVKVAAKGDLSALGLPPGRLRTGRRPRLFDVYGGTAVTARRRSSGPPLALALALLTLSRSRGRRARGAGSSASGIVGTTVDATVEGARSRRDGRRPATRPVATVQSSVTLAGVRLTIDASRARRAHPRYERRHGRRQLHRERRGRPVVADVSPRYSRRPGPSTSPSRAPPAGLAGQCHGVGRGRG